MLQQPRGLSNIASMLLLLLIAVLVAALIWYDGKLAEPVPQYNNTIIVTPTNNGSDNDTGTNIDTDEQPTDEQPTDEQPTDEQPTDEQPADDIIACICDGSMAGEGCEQVRPDVCTAQYDPVCGCDGLTYGNPCNALAAGLSIWTMGECIAEE